MADPELLTVAEAMYGCHPTTPLTGPQTLKAAIEDYLKGRDNARTGEIHRAMCDSYPQLLSDKNPYASVSQALQDTRFKRVCRGRYCLHTETTRVKPPPQATVTLPSSASEKAQKTLYVAAELTQPFLARDIVNCSSLTMPQVVVGLKELNKLGKVQITEKLTNGMARWSVVTD